MYLSITYYDCLRNNRSISLSLYVVYDAYFCMVNGVSFTIVIRICLQCHLCLLIEI